MICASPGAQTRCSTASLRSSQTGGERFLVAADFYGHHPRVDRHRGPRLACRAMDVAVVGREGDEIGDRQRKDQHRPHSLGDRRCSFDRAQQILTAARRAASEPAAMNKHHP
jgi:hypothetical protein